MFRNQHTPRHQLSEEERMDLLSEAHEPPTNRDQVGALAVDRSVWSTFRGLYWHDDLQGLTTWYVEGFFPLYGARSDEMTEEERMHVEDVRLAAARNDFNAVANLMLAIGIDTKIRWVGRFSDLLSGDDRECLDLRAKYWAMDDDEEDEGPVSSEPIPDDRVEDFGYWLWELGLD